MSSFIPYTSVLQSFTFRRLDVDTVFLALCALHDIRATEIPAYDRTVNLFGKLQEEHTKAGRFCSLVVVSAADQRDGKRYRGILEAKWHWKGS